MNWNRETGNKRRHAPATARNRDFILDVLRRALPAGGGAVLEIASGTGEHAVHFAPRLAPRVWLPSNPDPVLNESVEAWRRSEGAANLRPPLLIDACAGRWAVEETPPAPPVDAIVNINMIHIAPWEACLGLMAGAGRILGQGGVLYLYGPYKQDGEHTAPSNAAFDESLKSRDPAWGVRDLEAVVAAAQNQDLAFEESLPMPANNLSLIFRKG